MPALTATDPHARIAGALLVIGSALMFSLSGVLTKAIAADGWTVICWRGLVGGITVAAYVACRRNGRPLGAVFRIGPSGWMLATVGSLSSVAFIYAFKLTYVANVAVIYATAPFIAAALGWLLMREAVQPRTLIAAVLSLAGVAVMVAGDFGAISFTGELLALAMTIGCALYMVLIRRFRDVPAVWAGGVSALQLFAVGWLMSDPLAVSGRDMALLVAFGLSFAAAVVLWTEGTKLIPAAQSGLLGTAETPFAVALAWLLLGELPPSASLIGGAIVLAAVIRHISADSATDRPVTRPD